MLAILRKKLDENQVPYFYLDGATEARLRSNMAEKFNNGEKSMFLISLKAGGTGLNLTGADVVMHYDQWWNPAVMNQAADRAHRYGQEKTLQVISLVTKNTIEEKILSLQEKKKNLVDSVLNVQEDLLGKITAEELRALFV
jgi:SNF2 family DNA or RNA helicase